MSRWAAFALRADECFPEDDLRGALIVKAAVRAQVVEIIRAVLAARLPVVDLQAAGHAAPPLRTDVRTLLPVAQEHEVSNPLRNPPPSDLLRSTTSVLASSKLLRGSMCVLTSSERLRTSTRVLASSLSTARLSPGLSALRIESIQCRLDRSIEDRSEMRVGISREQFLQATQLPNEGGIGTKGDLVVQRFFGIRAARAVQFIFGSGALFGGLFRALSDATVRACSGRLTAVFSVRRGSPLISEGCGVVREGT